MKTTNYLLAALVLCLAVVPLIGADSDAATPGSVIYYDGSEAVHVQDVDDYAKVKIEKVDDLKKDGYYLTWSLNADGSGRHYHTGDTVNLSDSETKTLYAVWTEGIDFSEYIPWLFVVAGAIVALLGLRFHYVLIAAGGAVAAIGVLELLGVINLF